MGYKAIVDSSTIDTGLWEHVRPSVEAENWSAVASQTVIFVEDCFRKWCDNPTGRNGRKLYGKELFLRVLGDDSSYRLGTLSEPSEAEGWRDLGLGLILALGNVDRHSIQSREDAREYAMGVLGLGSLLLTELKYRHNDELTRRRTRLSGEDWGLSSVVDP